MITPETNRPIVIITGTSRDVGKAAALAFAQKGFDIIGGHNRDKSDALQNEVVKAAEELGARMYYVKGNLRDLKVPGLYLQTLQEHFPGRRVKALIANAAEGWKQPLDEAREMNVGATNRLVDIFLDHLEDGGVIVFNTSGPAHQYDQIKDDPAVLDEIPLDYHPVMISKNEAEQGLLKRKQEFLAKGVRFMRVVGNALDGTFVTRALNRGNAPLMNLWLTQTEGGKFPVAEDMASGDVRAVFSLNPPNHAEYVGITSDYHRYLTQAEIEDLIPHRGGLSLLDRVEDLKRGIYGVGYMADRTKEQYRYLAGHFPGFEVMPGLLTIEAAAQLGALVGLSTPEFRGRSVLLTSANNFNFAKPIFPAHEVRLEAEIVEMKRARGLAHVKVFNETLNATVTEGDLGFALLKR